MLEHIRPLFGVQRSPEFSHDAAARSFGRIRVVEGYQFLLKIPGLLYEEAWSASEYYINPFVYQLANETGFMSAS